jgi:hypothetical protein
VEVGVAYLLSPEAVVVSGLLGPVLLIIFFLLIPGKPGAGKKGGTGERRYVGECNEIRLIALAVPASACASFMGGLPQPCSSTVWSFHRATKLQKEKI